MAIHRLQMNAPDRAKSSEEYGNLCGFSNVKMETIKKVFVISAISLLIILSVGGYLFKVCPTSLAFKITYMGSLIPTFIILGESVYEIAKRYDIFPSCMYRNQ